MTHELIVLPYEREALEPAISAQTIDFHHGKHLLNYVNTLNKLIEGTEFSDASLVDIVRKSEGAIFNNAGQVLNHNLYFLQFGKDKAQAPTGGLLSAIEAQYGSLEAFKKEFENAGVTLFGSGWVWLAADKGGKLSIEKEPNAGNPVRKGLNPLLGFDVWEHSYYLSHQNRRVDHLHDLWSIVDWEEVSKRYGNPIV